MWSSSRTLFRIAPITSNYYKCNILPPDLKNCCGLFLKPPVHWNHNRTQSDGMTSRRTTIDNKKKYEISLKNLSTSTTKSKWNRCQETLNPYMQLMRLDKPIGSWLLFWPCGWSIAMSAAPGCLPDPYMLGLFAAGAWIMRGAGCTINDMWDKEIDGKIERTKSRPLASGQIHRWDAFAFLGIQLGCGALILTQLNWNAILLGASSVGLVIIYPLMKRVTDWPQFVLGLTFNWGALLGWCATQGSVDWAVCLPLYLAGVSWTIIYDTIYAHQDKKDDMAIGIKSTAIRFGENTKLWLAGFSATMIASLSACGLVSDQTWPYYSAVALVSIHILRQVHSLRVDNAEDCAQKFVSNKYVGLLLFVGIMFGTILKIQPTGNAKALQLGIESGFTNTPLVTSQ